MDNEVKEKKQGKKKVSVKVINHKFTEKAYKNLGNLQDLFTKTTGGKITQEALINRILESASLPL